MPDAGGGATAGVSGTGGATGGGTGGTAGGGTGGATDGDAGADHPSTADSGLDASVGTRANGAACDNARQCASAHCIDQLCCSSDCAGICRTCASAASPGTCLFAPWGSDPRNQCEDQGVGSCGGDGFCNGSGACRLYAAGQVCGGPACTPANTAVIPTFTCNGAAACVPGAAQDCKGYLCASGTCATTCDSDGRCAPGAFCSAGRCVPGPSNLAGNGDLEYGTTTGWGSFAGGPSPELSSIKISMGAARAGDYSVVTAGRTQYYQGPSYDIPTGPGRYVISVWGMQRSDPSPAVGIVNVSLSCRTATFYLAVGFAVTMPRGTWTQFSGMLDTSMPSMPVDCLPAASPPGVIKRATLFISQLAPDGPAALPDLFADDLVIQVPDNHNLVGNPSFEAGATYGWAVSGTGTMKVSTTISSAGTNSLVVAGRATSASGPSYAVPLGAARYKIAIRALHTGTGAHDLVLEPSYTCLGAPPTVAAPVATVLAAAPGTWAPLAGTVTMPPANAAAGCRLIQADVHVRQEAGTCGTIECPDLYVDDASIAIAP